MKQILKEEWDEVANSIQLCELPYSVSDIETKFDLTFFEYSEFGLGECFGTYIQSEKSKFFLMGHVSKKSREPGVTIFVRSFEREPFTALTDICEFLKLEKRSLLWITQYLSLPKWIVYRIDDNNNEIEMYRFQNEEIANWFKEEYERKNYNQTCFLKNDNKM